MATYYIEHTSWTSLLVATPADFRLLQQHHRQKPWPPSHVQHTSWTSFWWQRFADLGLKSSTNVKNYGHLLRSTHLLDLVAGGNPLQTLGFHSSTAVKNHGHLLH